ncbi:MAG: hypothetical protein A2Z25_14375 [Planctomycetes bacterium RBG_16_55_9]|nr:MAG: hypothetical protein A2Z25_14375 [Planctomycetes bacterium RBG_16_55_9]
MKLSLRMILSVAFGLFAVITLGLVFLYPWTTGPQRNLLKLMKLEVKKAQQKKVILLSETDHQALLKACRKLSREIDQGSLVAPGRYMVRHKPDPEVKQFPQVILDLEPMFVETCTDGRIRVGMMGGIHHFGVTAYPENYKAPSSDFKYGDKKIIDGLWYYEDGYNSRYDKWIEKQIQKRKGEQGKIKGSCRNL